MTSPIDTTLHERPERPARALRRLVAVCVASEPVREPREVEVRPGALEIGRAVGPHALGIGADARMSRRHVLLELDAAGDAFVTPIGSAPTEINGHRILTRTPLTDGDVLLLGESALVFRDAMGTRSAPSIEGVIGESPGLRAVRRAIAKIAAQPVTVLILGESGTGKEVAARALHALSGRSGSFVAVNCAAIPASLAESQLFGHVAGAFTGAQKASAGVFRAADGGTIFLDELADLPLDLQPKLLRALEERSVVAVGSTTAVPVDVRVVTATNRDLIGEIKAGRFRGDLYARLAEFTLQLPALRESREDILRLLEHHYRAPLPALRFELVRALLVHPWPFNVRELRTIAAQLRILAEEESGPLGATGIGDRLARTARLHEPESGAHRTPSDATPASASRSSAAQPPRPVAAPPDRAELEALLRAHRGNVTELARASGRSRRQVYRWLEATQLDPEQFRDG